MSIQEKEKNSKLPNLFVGPFGRAQMWALQFTEGLSRVDSQIILIEKMEAINEMIDSTDMTETELQLANKLLDELAICFIDLSGDLYGTGVKKEVH